MQRMKSGLVFTSGLVFFNSVGEGAAQACTGCVVMDTVATLNLENAPTYPSSEGLLARRAASGPWVFVDRQVPTEFLIFDESGEYQRKVGRVGDGPGEFGAGPRGITWLTFASDGLLWVFSQGGRRADVFGSDFEWVRTVSLSDRVRKAVPLNGGRFGVVAQALNGAYFAILDSAGQLSRLESPAIQAADPEIIAIASDGASRVWVSEPHTFRVWEWSEGEEPRLVAQNPPEWFAETFNERVRAELGDFLDTMGATILALTPELGANRLWVTAGVPSSTLEPATFRAAMERQDPNLVGLILDHVVVALSLNDGTLGAEGRFDYLPSLRGVQSYTVSDNVLLKVIAPRVP